MKVENGFLKIFFVTLSLTMLAATGVNADSGTPFWSMYVGNSWDYSGHNLGSPGSWNYRVEVTGPDEATIPGKRTFVIREYENGTPWEYEWYSISASEMRLWRVESYDDLGNPPVWNTITIGSPPDGGFVVAKNPFTVGEQWTETKSGTYDGTPVSLTVTVTVESYSFITVPRGTYKAYKINFSLSVNGILEGVQNRWFVPYLGFVYREDGTSPDIDIEELTSMNIRKEIVNFGGEGKTDIAFYRPGTGVWWITPSSGAPAYGYGWGGPGFKPVPGDYDGDGKTDIAIYDTTGGAWWIIPSSGIPAYGVGWGGSAFKSVPGDYDGDRKTDIAIYDTTGGAWWIIPSSGIPAYGVGWGGSAFKPVPGDYDGDGKTDVAIYNTTNGGWWIIPSSGVGPQGQVGAYGVGWGGSAFKPVPGDYDGDGKTDVAIYNTTNGGWWIIPSSGVGPQGQVGAYGVGWGGSGFTPVPGDYDGDGKTDFAIYQSSNGGWWIIYSSDGSYHGMGWGGDASDIPLTTNPD